jgi:hypothetical protein
MSYIGRDIRTGAFRQLDDISSGFDGSDTTHTMQVNSTNVSVGDVNQILLSLGGVIQKPGTDFTVSGSTLTFTTAPAANTSFFAILLGSDNGGTVTPTDESVTDDKLANTISTINNTGGNLTVDVSGNIVLDADTQSSSDGILLKDGGTLYGSIFRSGSDLNIMAQAQDEDIVFKGNDGGSETEVMRIDVSNGGYIGIGTATPSNLVHMNSTGNHPTLEIRSTIDPNGSRYGGTLELALGDDGISGSGHADTQVGDNLGRVQFTGQGTDYSYGAGLVSVFVTTGDGDDPRGNQGTAMALFTKSVGSSSNSEKFRIAANGDLTATDTSISSNSDERLKENIQDYTYDINKFKQFKAKTFDWKNPTEHGGRSNNRGFIAQDILAIDDYWIDQVDLSSMKTQFKDVETEPEDAKLIPAASDGSRLAYTSKLGKKDAMYVSVIQQLITRIEALEDA